MIPTLDQIATASRTWFDADIGVDDIAENTDALNQIFNSLTALNANVDAAIIAAGPSDGVNSPVDSPVDYYASAITAASSAVDDWRDTLRSVPLEGNDDNADTRVSQLDTAIPALKTALTALFS